MGSEQKDRMLVHSLTWVTIVPWRDYASLQLLYFDVLLNRFAHAGCFANVEHRMRRIDDDVKWGIHMICVIEWRSDGEKRS